MHPQDKYEIAHFIRTEGPRLAFFLFFIGLPAVAAFVDLAFFS